MYSKRKYPSALTDEQYSDYIKERIVIHNKKYKTHTRNFNEYEFSVKHVEQYIKNDSRMLCLGTRNEHERECFAKILANRNIEVFSLDIAKEAQANFTCDFNKLSQHGLGKWDILYSNSLANAVDASDTVQDWMSVINPGGILIIGLFFGGKIINGAVCEFTPESANSFISNNNKMELLNEYQYGHWHYYTIKMR